MAWKTNKHATVLLWCKSSTTDNQGRYSVEFDFVPGSEHDALALKKLTMKLPAESQVFVDSTYTNYEIEDELWEHDQIALKVHRQSNAKRNDSASAAFIRIYA